MTDPKKTPPPAPKKTPPAVKPGKTMRLVMFTSKVCGACIALKKMGVLDKFAAAHPEVEVVDYSVADENGDVPDGSEYDKNDLLADQYEIEELPTLVLETPDGGELVRIENPVMMKLPKLEEIYAKQRTLLEAKQARRTGK